MGYLRRVQLYREPAQKPPACAIIISRDASIFVIFRLSVITVGGPCPYHTPSKGEKSQKRASPDDITKQAFCSCFSGPEDAAMLHRPASFDVPKTQRWDTLTASVFRVAYHQFHFSKTV